MKCDLDVENIGELASAYVEAGLALVPIPKGKKGPNTPGWQTRENAITTSKAALTISGANIGLAHRWSAQVTCALDIDDVEIARRHLAQHDIDLDSLLFADNAVQIVSGKVNRAKLLYRVPEKEGWLPTVQRNSQGFELRCANRDGSGTVQDVLPPSIHPETGQPYRWSGNGDWRRIPNLPEPLLAFWKQVASDKAATEANPSPSLGIGEGGRNIALTSIAGTMRRHGMDANQIEVALHTVNQESCAVPLPESEVSSIAKSVARYAPTNLPSTRNYDALGHFDLIDLSLVMEEQTAGPEFLLEPYLPRGQVTLLGGHGGLGKSYLALILAAHVAAGVRFAGLGDTTARRVCFLSLEDERAVLLSRLRDIIVHFRLPLSLRDRLKVFDCSDSLAALMAEEHRAGDGLVATHLLAEAKEAASNCDLVIVDNASDALAGNENSRRQVRQFIRAIRAIGEDRNAALLLLAHIDKNAALRGSKSNSYSGSTAWHNSARSRLSLTSDENGAIWLNHEKSNYGEVHKPIRLRRVLKGILEPVSDQAHLQQIEALEAEDDQAVLAAVIKAERKGVRILTATSGPNTSAKGLFSASRMPERLNYRGPGKKRVEASLMRLERSGLIARESVQDKAQRKAHEQWIFALA